MSAYGVCKVEGCYLDELDRGFCYGHAGQNLAREFQRTMMLFPFALAGAFGLVIGFAALMQWLTT